MKIKRLISGVYRDTDKVRIDVCPQCRREFIVYEVKKQGNDETSYMKKELIKSGLVCCPFCGEEL